jgi:hypothetical protein
VLLDQVERDVNLLERVCQWSVLAVKRRLLGKRTAHRINRAEEIIACGVEAVSKAVLVSK